MLDATLTAAQNDDGTATGYQGGSDPRGTLDDATFAYRGSGYRIDSLNVSGSTLSLEIPPQCVRRRLLPMAPENRRRNLLPGRRQQRPTPTPTP